METTFSNYQVQRRFCWFFLNCSDFMHQISHTKPSKCDSIFGTKISVCLKIKIGGWGCGTKQAAVKGKTCQKRTTWCPFLTYLKTWKLPVLYIFVKFKGNVSRFWNLVNVFWIGIFSHFLKQYSEISGRIKHPFSLTPIDRYSLGKLIFKISVGYDFTLARYAE